jgi:hypothetical protein
MDDKIKNHLIRITGGTSMRFYYLLKELVCIAMLLQCSLLI